MARRRGRSTPIRIKVKKTKSISKARSTKRTVAKKPRNRRAQDLTLINLDALKKDFKAFKAATEKKQKAIIAEGLKLSVQVRNLTEAHLALERATFPLQTQVNTGVVGPTGGEQPKAGD
jgi:hypothetical protein